MSATAERLCCKTAGEFFPRTPPRYAARLQDNDISQAQAACVGARHELLFKPSPLAPMHRVHVVHGAVGLVTCMASSGLAPKVCDRWELQ